MIDSKAFVIDIIIISSIDMIGSMEPLPVKQ